MFQNTKNNQWWILPFIIFSFAFAFFCSIYFYKEKFLVDTGFRAYHMANILNFSPSNNRYILIFNQILPLISLNLEVPIKTYLQIFSLGNLTFFTFGTVFSYLYFKEKIISLLFVVAYVFFFGKFFFHIPDMEIHLQAFFLCLLGLMYFGDEKLNWKNWMYIIIISLIISFGHPIGLLSLTYLLFIIIYNRGKDWYNYTLAAILLMTIFYLRILNSDSYESSQFRIFSIENFFFDFKYKIHSTFDLFLSHPTFCILLLLIFFQLLKKKSYFEILSLNAFLTGYTIIVLTYNSSEYTEAYFLLMGTIVLILSFPLIFQPLIHKKSGWTFFIFITIIFSEWNSVLKHRSVYTTKTKLIENMSYNAELHHQSNSFFLYSSDENSFITTYEFSSSILLSTLFLNRKSIIFIPEKNIPLMIKSMWPFMDKISKEKYFPDSTNINTKEKLVHYAEVIYSENYIPKNIQKMWNIHHINTTYFTVKEFNFEILK